MDETEQPPAPAEEPELAPGRLRVQFAAPKGASPIHALRVGTFTDSMGRETTFTADDLRGMAERLNEGATRRRPPINEGHDYGRAVGRMTEAYTRHNDNHLYIVPRWNTEGQRLLSEEVYDAFSIELERGPRGYTVIGGALTNYPAVDGLRPVALSASAPDAVATLSLTLEELPMSDETQAATPPAPAAQPAPPAMPTLDLTDPAVQSQLNAYAGQMQAYMRQQHEALMQAAAERSRAEFERWKAEEGRRAALLAFAQHVTTPTIARPTSVAYSVEQVMDILSAPTPEKVRQVFEDALAGSLLVAGGPIGSARGGDEPSEAERLSALTLEYQRQGMSPVDATKAAIREMKKGGR